MDIQQQTRLRLETIREESEKEDEESKPREGQEEGLQIEEGDETTELIAGDESEEDEDDDALLSHMGVRRRLRYLRKESLPRRQSANNYQEEMDHFSVSEQSSVAADISDEAARFVPWKLRPRNKKRHSSGELGIKISKIQEQRNTPATMKKRYSKRQKKSSLFEPFPTWLVNVMINIEEAKTHQLVVE